MIAYVKVEGNYVAFFFMLYIQGISSLKYFPP